MLPKKATKKQRRVYKYALKNPYSIWAVDPRLGKTMVGIAVQQRAQRPCLVIAPGYLVDNWEKEVHKWAAKGTQVTVFREGKKIYYPFDADFVVISYSLVQKAAYLFEWAWMVEIDEVHNLKSMSTKRTQFIHQQIFENSIRRVHLLSGTIIKNRVQEFYSPIAITYYDPRLEKKKDPSNDFLKRFEDEIAFADYFSYRREYKVKITDRRGRTYYMPVPKWEGLKNVAELKRYLKGRYIRVKATNKDLPPIIHKTILVSKSPNKALLKAFEDHFSLDGKSSVRIEVKVEAAMKKVPFTIEYVEDLLRSVPCVLVYSDHVEPITQIAKHFGVTAITSKISQKKRNQLADDFQAGKGKILCSTIGCLKEGKDLFRSEHIVLNDICWVPGDLKQVINRIRKLGERNPRTVHEIFGSPQDEKISGAIIDKVETIRGATDA